MQRWLWIGAVTLAMAACTARNSASNAGSANTTQHVLRVASVADPRTLNPYLSETDASYDLASLTYSYLIVADDRGRLIGDLATVVPDVANGGISADGRTYVYRLRRNVRWHDGPAFSAADVIASWKAIVNPANPVPDREGYDKVASIVAPDPSTLVVHLRERYPPFVTRFFTPLQEGAKPVLAAHVLARNRDFAAGELAGSAIGTGPFRFESWHRGEDVRFTRFDGYYRGRPGLDGVLVRFVGSAQTAANLLATHEVDLLVEPQAALLAQYRAMSGVSISTVPWNAQMSLLFNCAKPGLRAVSLRRAIADAIPYASILRAVLGGVAAPARSFLAPTSIGYLALTPRRLDVEAARRELSRVPKGTKLSFSIATLAGSTTFERIALLMQSSLRKIGIDATIKSYTYDLLAAPSGPILGGTYDLSLFGSSLNWDPDEYDSLACDRRYPHGANVVRFCDERFDSLERAGLQTDRTPDRAVIYRKASTLLWSMLPYVPLTEGRRLVVRSKALRNYRPNPTGTPWWNAWQWEL